VILDLQLGEDKDNGWSVVHKLRAYAVYGAAAMLALLFIRETRDIRLEDLDISETSSAANTGTMAIGRPEM